MKKAISYFMLGAAASTTFMIFMEKGHYWDRMKREKDKIVSKIKAVSE